MTGNPADHGMRGAIVAVMIGCLTTAAGLALHAGSPLFAGLLGLLGSGGGFTARVLAGEVQQIRRRAMDLLLPAALGGAFGVTGSVLPVWAVLLALLSWNGGSVTASNLSRLFTTRDGEVATVTLSRMGNYILAGAALLFFLAAIEPAPPAYLATALYVLLGVGALTWLQYSVRREAWMRGGASIVAPLGRRWLLSALAAFLGLFALAALIPTGLLLAVAARLWRVLGPALAQPLLALLQQTRVHYTPVQGGAPGGTHHYGAGRILPHVYPPLHSKPVAASPEEIILWILIVLILVYLAQALWQHRFRGIPFRVALIAPLLGVWRRLHSLLAVSLDTVSLYLPDRLALLVPGAARTLPDRPRRSLGRLTPRQRIELYYLRVLYRAGRAGFSYRPSETPREYEGELGPNIGIARVNLEALTDAYIEARYSPREPPMAEAQRARSNARQVAQALRQVQGPPNAGSAAERGGELGRV